MKVVLLFIASLLMAVAIEQLPSKPIADGRGDVEVIEQKTKISDLPHAELASVQKITVSTREIGEQEAYKVGWSGSEWQCLLTLWTNESNWRTEAYNTSSGAMGIAQALPGSKMASEGADYQDNPRTQIRWGIGYIKGRYQTPCKALSFWNAQTPHHWY